MKLYFGNAVSVATTIMLLAFLGFIGYTVFNRADINFWGRRSVIVGIFGLVICCLAAARDGLDKSIQYAIDQSCAQGIFPLISWPTIIGCVGAVIILCALAATPLAKSQQAREVWFYVLSAAAVGKIIAVELARILLR